MIDAAAADVAGGAGVAIPVVRAGDWAYDRVAEVWRPLALIEAGTEQEDLSPDELGDLLDAGAEVPAWFTPPAVAGELRRARPPRARRGFVLFLTGLSGSGKSTIARDLADVLAERGDRRVSLLDGDLVRQLLSAGLTFSRADRDLNIARIGFVAAEVARHGGIAICAPIAPYAAARTLVRQMVVRGRRLPADPRGHAARGLRGARPQGPVREGAGGDHRPLHRDLRPVRGTARRRPDHRHVGDDARAGHGGRAEVARRRGAGCRPKRASDQSSSSARVPSSSRWRKLPILDVIEPDITSRCRDSTTKLMIPLITRARPNRAKPRTPMDPEHPEHGREDQESRACVGECGTHDRPSL